MSKHLSGADVLRAYACTQTHSHVLPTQVHCTCCHHVSWCVHILGFPEEFCGLRCDFFLPPTPQPFWHTFSVQEHLCVPDTVNWHCFLWIFVCSIYWFIHSLTYACAHTRTHTHTLFFFAHTRTHTHTLFFFAHLSMYKVQCSPHFCCQPVRPKLQLDTGKKKWIKTQSLTLLVSALKQKKIQEKTNKFSLIVSITKKHKNDLGKDARHYTVSLLHSLIYFFMKKKKALKVERCKVPHWFNHCHKTTSTLILSL